MNPTLSTDPAIPDNVEEIIEAYMRHQLDQLYPHHDYGQVIIDLHQIDGSPRQVEYSCYCNDSVGRTTGRSLADAVGKQVDQIKSHDPVKEKRDQIAKLQAEIAELGESERGAL